MVIVLITKEVDFKEGDFIKIDYKKNIFIYLMILFKILIILYNIYFNYFINKYKKKIIYFYSFIIISNKKLYTILEMLINFFFLIFILYR